MSQFFLLFSHNISPAQQMDACHQFGITEIRALPPELQARWSQVPAELEQLDEFALPIWQWLEQEAKEGDHVLIQGEMGLSYATVNEALRLGLIPVYATTRRESKEITMQDGRVSKTLVFQHVRFRRYPPISTRIPEGQ